MSDNTLRQVYAKQLIRHFVYPNSESEHLLWRTEHLVIFAREWVRVKLT
jgi:hypothetical protein